ncbi:hypothetical protein EHF33_07290 [Deinococcus psychrotolerans]|uniref:Big-1 domain-containing protein n=1 Tax=Deinococcus psychrotolerans TaxID=2489213 RepID=A0A3G8YB30_9DEIO|nr:hypothetical protein [Deinococcus psychrotolerans]AZI42572.1 hypothetical protein EHF33_07290 [Deinococcus psychrotolerans]
MKKNLGLLALTGVIALASCSQGTTSGPTTHKLTINLNGPASADFDVTKTGGATDTVTVSGTFSKSYANGAYTVTPKAAPGFDTPSGQSADLNTADQALSFTYVKTNGPVITPPVVTPAAIKSISLVSLKDDTNALLPTKTEVNANKVATLFASQTEENVCAVVKVLDVNGNPLANANVTAESTGPDAYNVTISSCSSTVTTQATGGQKAPIVTDAQGFAKIRFFATYGNVNSNNNGDPIKFIINAESGGSSVAAPLELKGFFLNMSHLYVTEVGQDTRKAPNRIGSDVGTYNNIFVTPNTIPNDTNPTNAAIFNVQVYDKQPQTNLHNPQDFGGYVVYTLSGQDAARVHFVLTGAEDSISADGRTYTDRNPGSGIRIEPNADVTQAQVGAKPLQVDLKASYVFQAIFGNTTYDFPLKDITFHKKYTTGFLSINKSVDNHVLTWAGPDVTLAPTGTLPEPFLATYTITTKNQSTTDAVYNATVADQLPAELGVVVGSISNGGTYDAAKHAITWNYTGTPALQTIEANGTRTFTFQVFARQKPGYKFQSTAQSAGFTVQPYNGVANLPYSDPYPVTDGTQINDTTVSYFPQSGSFANQVVTDYDPTADESTINVVRPIYRLSKTLASGQQLNLVQGASANYVLNFSQRDRTTSGAPEDVLYPALFQKYPNEFSGAGQVAGQDVPRQNPYGYNVSLNDTFQTELDFTNATPITVTNAVPNTLTNPNITSPRSFNVTFPAGGANSATQYISWAPIGIFNGKDTASAAVQLTLSQLTNVNGGNRYINCAYLSSSNLNQPFTRSVEYLGSAANANLGTWYPTQNINAIWQPEVDGPNSTFGVLRTTVPGGNTAVQNGLESCAPVFDVKPLAPRLTLTTKGEYTDNNSAIIDANKKDGYSISTFGGNFYYKVDSQNTGGVATPVTLTFNLDDTTVVQFPAGGSYKLYRSTDGTTFVDTGLTAVRSAGGDQITFNNVTVPQNGFVRAVLAGDPNTKVGNTNMTTTEDYLGQQLQVLENTTTNP